MKARNQGNGATKGNSSKNLRERERKNQEIRGGGGKKKDPNNEARIQLLTKKSLASKTRAVPPHHPLLALEKAADPSEPHDRIRIRYQESVTKFGAAAFVGLH